MTVPGVPVAEGPTAGAVRRRLKALDAFRGTLVVLRILIGSQVAEIAAPALLHAKGFGLTVADLVAPGFLFILGMAVPVSMSALLRPSDPRGPGGRRFLPRIVRRTVLLYAIGMFLNAFPFLREVLEHLRFVGVLQRLAVVYLAVSLLYVTCAWSVRPAAGPAVIGGARRPVARVLARGFLLGGFPVVCVAVWIVATYTFHSPWSGCADVRALTPDCSLEAYVDTGLWGVEHNFDGGRFDPEGLVSTLVAVVNCWAGLVVGMDIVRNKRRYDTVGGVRGRVSLLTVVGVACVGAGLALGPVIPIGKQLWTPSYALVTIGIMTVGFGLVLLAFDGGLWPSPDSPHTSAAPAARSTAAVRRGLAPVGDTLVALGRNPLFFYVLSELVTDTLDYLPLRYHGEEGTVWSVLPEAGLAPWMPAPLASVVWAVLWLLLFYVPLARLLSSRGWYLRV
ncbi:acyltransferase family protein [Kitasatospora sp. NPDC059722]|uniref:acyltransferase family protein n=1 Tax=Kitasatospora sp. NPDC059722 TaxID=3346925 RepID=UPI0036B317FE